MTHHHKNCRNSTHPGSAAARKRMSWGWVESLNLSHIGKQWKIKWLSVSSAGGQISTQTVIGAGLQPSHYTKNKLFQKIKHVIHKQKNGWALIRTGCLCSSFKSAAASKNYTEYIGCQFCSHASTLHHYITIHRLHSFASIASLLPHHFSCTS